MDFSQLNFTQILSSFLVLLGIIDIIGAVAPSAFASAKVETFILTT